MIEPLVDQLAALKPGIIIHSDMQRTRAIAEPLAKHLGVTSIAEPLWQERNFGTWEGQTWNSIYRATGNAMDGMTTDPDHFQPGGGETTRALARRVEKALKILPNTDCVVVISHGGPIACARAIRSGASLEQLALLVPNTGSLTIL